MKGDNPIRAAVNDDGRQLAVKHIFATWQGEGPYAGWPAVFVRLGGCNLACAFCDTEFEDFSALPLETVVERVKKLAVKSGKMTRHLVVITGGEPLRQNIVPLCERLLAEGFKVQIETNGTLYRPLPEEVDIVCSPKNTGKGYFPIRPDLLARIGAFKFIISRHDPLYDHVAEVGQAQHDTPVYVQPMDEYDAALNAENMALTLELAERHGCRLSLQIHKIAGVE